MSSGKFSTIFQIRLQKCCKNYGSLGVMIAGTAGNLVGTVDLLGNNESSDHVWEDKLTEAPEKICSFASFF